MATYKSEKYVWNSVTNTWDLYYDKTSADNIVETANYKVLTNVERDQISTYLTTFNAASKLVLLNSSGKIPDALINADFADYLKRDGSNAMTGGLLTPSVTADFYSFDSIGNDRAAVMSKSGGGVNLLVKTGDEGIDTTNYAFLVGQALFGGAVIKNINNPVDPQDAATKSWVEQLVSQGTHIIAAVRAATTANVTSLSGTVTIDGVALVEGDRVLVREQTTASQNGVYIVNSGTWTKVANDSDKGSLVTVLEGTTQRRHQYYNQTGTTWAVYWVDDDYYATINGGLELAADGFGFGIKLGGITNNMIDDYVINPIKIQAFASYDDGNDWSYFADASNPTELEAHFGNLYGAIKLLRGTTKYNFDNSQTIADAYDKIALKNSITYGTAVPSGNAGGTDGDIYLRRL